LKKDFIKFAKTNQYPKNQDYLINLIAADAADAKKVFEEEKEITEKERLWQMKRILKKYKMNE
jgi:hypothetical protein